MQCCLYYTYNRESIFCRHDSYYPTEPWLSAAESCYNPFPSNGAVFNWAEENYGLEESRDS